MRKFEIMEEGLQELLNFLASQQYAVVYQLIEKLQNLREIDGNKGCPTDSGDGNSLDCDNDANGPSGIRNEPKS